MRIGKGSCGRALEATGVPPLPRPLCRSTSIGSGGQVRCDPRAGFPVFSSFAASTAVVVDLWLCKWFASLRAICGWVFQSSRVARMRPLSHPTPHPTPIGLAWKGFRRTAEDAEGEAEDPFLFGAAVRPRGVDPSQDGPRGGSGRRGWRARRALLRPPERQVPPYITHII